MALFTRFRLANPWTWPARHFGPALRVLASLGIAEAAPPEGKPVFIHIEGLAPTSVGLNGFIVAGDFTEGGAFQWMPTSGVTLVGGGLGTGTSAATARRWPERSSTRTRFSKRPGGRVEGRGARSVRSSCAVPCSIGELCHGDEWRRARGGGRRLVRHRPGQSVPPFYGLQMGAATGYVLLPTQTGDYTRAQAVSADGRVVVGIDAALTGLRRGVEAGGRKARVHPGTAR